MTLALIAAIARDGAIGKNGGLPWDVLLTDRRWFRLVTLSPTPYATACMLCDDPHIVVKHWRAALTSNACIMGRKTWQSLPGPLVRRENIVVSAAHRAQPYPGARIVCGSLPIALACACAEEAPHTFIIGGAQVYDAALRLPELETLYISEVDEDFDDADTHWPATFVADFPDHTRITKPVRDIHPTAYHRWQRTHVSLWIEEPDRPRYRFGIWER